MLCQDLRSCAAVLRTAGKAGWLPQPSVQDLDLDIHEMPAICKALPLLLKSPFVLVSYAHRILLAPVANHLLADSSP